MTLDDLDLERIPSHVSIIMDGNGRWAKARGLERSEGHVAGVDSLREAVTTSVRLGLDVLSAYNSMQLQFVCKGNLHVPLKFQYFFSHPFEISF